MPRKGPATKRQLVTDPVYGSPIVTALVNKVLKSGKRSLAERIVYGALEGCRDKTGNDPVVTLKRAIGFADWADTEVVRPTYHPAVECLYHSLLFQQGFIPTGFFANRSTDALHPFLRRSRAQIGTPALRRIAPTKGIP